VSLIPTIYQSTDPGAPQLTGQVGTFLALVRALLVTGYGAAPNAKAGLGWTEEFTGANKAVFRGNPVSASGYRVRIDDSNALFAWLRGFESMSDVDTGTNLVPTAAQFANGALWPKSSVANTTARAWWAIGNERCLYLFIDVFGAGLHNAVPYFVGDLLSLKPSDLHCFALSHAQNTSWTGSGNPSALFFGGHTLANAPATNSHLIIARGPSGLPGATYASLCSMLGNSPTSSRTFGGTDQMAYPMPASGGLMFGQPLVCDGAFSLRGVMPGLLAPFHYRPLSDLVRRTDLDGMAGTSVIAKSFRTQATGSNEGQVMFLEAVEWS